MVPSPHWAEAEQGGQLVKPLPASRLHPQVLHSAGVSALLISGRPEPGLPDTHFLFWIQALNYHQETIFKCLLPAHSGRTCSDSEGRGKQEGGRKSQHQLSPALPRSPLIQLFVSLWPKQLVRQDAG